MSVKKADRILNELRINCDHDVANLIEQLQQRNAELERERDDWKQKSFNCVEHFTRENRELRNELDALEAHVERTKKAYAQAGVDIKMLFDIQPKQDDNSYLVDGQDCTELNRVIMQSPQTSLAEVRAKQARRSYKQGALWALGEPETVSFEVVKKAEQHAAAVREGVSEL